MSKRTQNCTGQYQISFLNNKKVPITTSPLIHENEFFLDFKEKAEIDFSPNNVPYKITTVNYPPDSITLPKNFYQPLSS